MEKTPELSLTKNTLSKTEDEVLEKLATFLVDMALEEIQNMNSQYENS